MTGSKLYYTYRSEFGNILIVCEDGVIKSLRVADYQGESRANSAAEKAAKQLDEYFSGKRRQFDLPLNPDGTAFQQSVWKALISIPYGETRSYKQVAQMVGNPNASRAVGMANNKNPIAIIIPCHRVLGSDGSLVGYAYGLEMKRKLIELEERNRL